MPEGNGETYEIGLAMAGAISAGAYSAGVIDFLFQALEEWERHRGQPGVPNHSVCIKVISGASAGAITGALGAAALAERAEWTAMPSGFLGADGRPGGPRENSRTGRGCRRTS